MRKLDKADIDRRYIPKVSIQNYAASKIIDGVELVDVRNFVSDDGDFCELGRLTKNGELEGFPNFKVLQINYSLMLPGSVKAWHLHFSQEDIWFIPAQDRLLVGLIDMRKNSETKGHIMRFVMGGGKTRLLYIPRGVAHGVSNMGIKEARIIYFVNQKFDLKKPDERRLPWDLLGADFWKYKFG